MISLFTTFLPYLFVLYYIYRSYNEPVYVMGIPFLMFLGPCIFFENPTLFIIPFRSFDSIAQNADILKLVWLAICWVIFKIRNDKYSKKNIGNKYSGKRINILDYFIVFLMIILIIGLGLVLKEYYNVVDVYDKFFILMSLFLGYFIIKDVARYTEATVLKDFIFSIVIINTIAASLYFIHQGLHIQLYSTVFGEYHTEVVNGEIITRTFWFMPNLLLFSISYLLVIRKSKSFVNIILLLINVLAVFISYTRTSIAIVFLLFIIYYLLTGFREENIGKTIKGLLIAGIASLAFFFVVSSFLPSSTKYFLSRFEESEVISSDVHSNNLAYRFYKTGIVINKMDPGKSLIGYGPVTEVQSSSVKFVKKATDDMAWAEVIFRWGYLGLFLFFLLYIISIFKSFFLFMNSDGLISQLALLLLLMILSQAIDGFTQSTIMYPNRFALSLWHFGILSAILVANNGNVNSRSYENENT